MNDQNGDNPTELDLRILTPDGELAALVTVSGMGRESSPRIVAQVETALRDAPGFDVRD